MTGGGLAIVNQQVRGTNTGGDSGDIRTGEAYGNDQYSEVQLTSTPAERQPVGRPRSPRPGRGSRPLCRYLLLGQWQAQAVAVPAG